MAIRIDDDPITVTLELTESEAQSLCSLLGYHNTAEFSTDAESRDGLNGDFGPCGHIYDALEGIGMKPLWGEFTGFVNWTGESGVDLEAFLDD